MMHLVDLRCLLRVSDLLGMDTGEEVLVDIVRTSAEESPQQPVSWVMDDAFLHL